MCFLKTLSYFNERDNHFLLPFPLPTPFVFSMSHSSSSLRAFSAAISSAHLSLAFLISAIKSHSCVLSVCVLLPSFWSSFVLLANTITYASASSAGNYGYIYWMKSLASSAVFTFSFHPSTFRGLIEPLVPTTLGSSNDASDCYIGSPDFIINYKESHGRRRKNPRYPQLYQLLGR